MEGKQQEKKRRKRRCDEQGRTFRCSCGKSYLSYPALYTHVKTKHDGKMSNNRAKQQPKIDEGSQSKIMTEVQVQQNPIQILIQFLNSYFSTKNQPKYQPNQEQENYYNNIKEHFQKKINDVKIKENQLESNCIDYVFGKFMRHVQNLGNSRIINFVTQFLFKMHNAINNLNNDSCYCSNNTAANLPLMFNFIITQHFINDKNANQYMRNPLMVCKTTIYLCHWLYNEKCTNLSIRFNLI